MGAKAGKLSQEEMHHLRAATHFDKNELQKWYIEFMVGCPYGYMNELEFIRLYKQFFPLGDPAKFASFVFNVFDQNSDGCISFREFITALSITMRGTADEKLEWAFCLYDLDKDGYITQREMLLIVKSIYAITHVRGHVDFNMADTPEKRVETIFNLMDKDHNGQVNMEEFRLGFKLDPWMVQALDINLGE